MFIHSFLTQIHAVLRDVVELCEEGRRLLQAAEEEARQEEETSENLAQMQPTCRKGSSSQ
jgi:hypothetical protein